MNSNNWFVRMYSYETDECVKQMGPMSEHKANKVDDGININLDNENYYTLVENDDA